MYITVEENIRIEFDRFYSATKFNNIELPEGLRDLLETLEANIICEYEGQTQQIEEEAYDEGFAEGRDVGHDEGYTEGHKQGYDEGFDEGETQAYEKGFQDGYDQAIADEDNDRA